jgi:hypothetical protein
VLLGSFYMRVVEVRKAPRLNCWRVLLCSPDDKQEIRFFEPDRLLHVWRPVAKEPDAPRPLDPRKGRGAER